MRRFSMVPTIVVGLSGALAGPGFAQDAALQPETASAGTAAGAADLQQALAAYVTAVPFDRKILRIEPDARGQKITLDPAAFLSELNGKQVTFAPLSFLLSERGDGNWNVFTADPVAFSAAYTLEGQEQSLSYRQASQVLKGIYSPELATFLSADGRVGSTATSSRDAISNSTGTIDSTRMSITSSPAAGGAADVAFAQTYDGVSQTTSFQFPAQEGDAPSSFGFDVRAQAVESRGSAKAFQTRPLLDLYTFVLSRAADLNRDAPGTLAGPFGAELKQKLRAALPLWAGFDADASAKNVEINSLYGQVGVQDARQSLRLSGIASDSSFDMDLALRGIAVTAPMMPAWAAPLVPDLIEIGFTVSGADLAAPAEMALRDADFSKDPPLSAEMQAKVQAAFAQERIRTKIKPSRIRSRDLDIAFTGDVSFLSGLPSATVAIEVGGLDTTIATLQGAAASAPEINQVVGMLQLAKGFSKPKDGGRLEWVLVAEGDGSVSINGTMLKGPDPAPAIDGTTDDAPTDDVPGEEPPAENEL